jgi:hypothetical protein
MAQDSAHPCRGAIYFSAAIRWFSLAPLARPPANFLQPSGLKSVRTLFHNSASAQPRFRTIAFSKAPWPTGHVDNGSFHNRRRVPDAFTIAFARIIETDSSSRDCSISQPPLFSQCPKILNLKS